jgi:hypothetical protein
MSFNIVSLFNGCHYSRQAARVVGCVYTKCLAALYLFTAHQIDITRSRLGSSYIQNSPLLNIRTFVNRNIWRRVIIRKLSTCAIPLACRNFRFVSAEQLSQGGGGQGQGALVQSQAELQMEQTALWDVIHSCANKFNGGRLRRVEATRRSAKFSFIIITSKTAFNVV